MTAAAPRIAAIIPCYRVRASILGVLDGLEPHVDAVFLVDDACPEGTGAHVRTQRPHVTVLTHAVNEGVGAATISGYRAASAAGFDLLLKLDGDGQMDPADIPALLAPLRAGSADYAKGDRLATAATRRPMPLARRVGNRLMARLARRMSGQRLADPMNGFTAITAATLGRLDLDRLDRRFFFETDLLVHLARSGARIAEIPMLARYGDETSNLGLGHILRHFPAKILAHVIANRTAPGGPDGMAHDG